MTRLNGIEWDNWNPRFTNMTDDEIVSAMGQLNDYWFAMVDYMIRNQSDKQRYSHVDFEQDAYKKENMSKNSVRKEDDKTYSPVAENSLFNVMSNLYESDKTRYDAIVDDEKQDFNKLVWDSTDNDGKKGNTY